MFLIQANPPAKSPLLESLDGGVVDFKGALYHAGSVDMSSDSTKNPDEIHKLFQVGSNWINGLYYEVEGIHTNGFGADIDWFDSDSRNPPYYHSNSTNFTSSVASSVNTVKFNMMTNKKIRAGKTIKHVFGGLGFHGQSTTVTASMRLRMTPYLMQSNGTLTSLGTSGWVTALNQTLAQVEKSMNTLVSTDSYLMIQYEREFTRGSGTSNYGPIVYSYRLTSTVASYAHAPLRIELE